MIHGGTRSDSRSEDRKQQGKHKERCTTTQQQNTANACFIQTKAIAQCQTSVTNSDSLGADGALGVC
jgi:hypothetical protein